MRGNFHRFGRFAPHFTRVERATDNYTGEERIERGGLFQTFGEFVKRRTGRCESNQ